MSGADMSETETGGRIIGGRIIGTSVPRREIRRDVSKRPMARALVRAWNRVATDHAVVALVTSSFTRDFEGVKMEETRARGALSLGWRTRQDYRRFLTDAPKTIRAGFGSKL